MLEKPILFSAPMVRALLDGSKTQTRRIWKMPKWAEWDIQAGGESAGLIMSKKHGEGWSYDLDEVESPYGREGDQLWVKETWGVVSYHMDGSGELRDWEPDRPATAIHELPFGRGYYNGHAIYRADGEFEWASEDGDEEDKSMWKPSIHMPRLVSRITIEVTNVRVERLNDCSEADAIAEGIQSLEINYKKYWRDYSLTNEESSCSPMLINPIESYKSIWNSINGDGSWAANPWVWVIEFKVKNETHA